MAGAWAAMHENIITGAIAMQSAAMAETLDAFGTDAHAQDFTWWHNFERLADECGHQDGPHCFCALCQRVGAWLAGGIQQVIAMEQQQAAAQQAEMQYQQQRIAAMAATEQQYSAARDQAMPHLGPTP